LQPDWVVSSAGVIEFGSVDAARTAAAKGIGQQLPVDALISNMLGYATDLERIV
jgi:hypothetical protein